LTISIEHLEEIVSSKIGEGVPSRFSFGEAGYKEVVDFDEIIGIHVDRQTKPAFQHLLEKYIMIPREIIM